MAKDFILEEMIERRTIPYYATDLYMIDENGDSCFLGGWSSTSKEEALDFYNALTEAQENETPFKDLHPDMQQALCVSAETETYPKDDYLVGEFEFCYCNANGVFFDVIAVD